MEFQLYVNWVLLETIFLIKIHKYFYGYIFLYSVLRELYCSVVEKYQD